MSAGRPRKALDPEQVKKLAAIDCSYDEMAAVLGCAPSTLSRNFAQAIKEGRDAGKVSLRRMQWQSAQKGNVTMQIWLGKQRLGQRDFKQDLSDISDDALAQEIQRRMKLNGPVSS